MWNPAEEQEEREQTLLGRSRGKKTESNNYNQFLNNSFLSFYSPDPKLFSAKLFLLPSSVAPKTDKINSGEVNLSCRCLNVKIRQPLPLEYELKQLKQGLQPTHKIEISILSNPCKSYSLWHCISFPQYWTYQAGL